MGRNTNNSKAKIIRVTLVTLTAVLFVFFTYTFISSYSHYRDIHQRIDNLHQSINDTQHDYTGILRLYSEAENEFRLFSVDFNNIHYENYKNSLGIIETKIDSMLTEFALTEAVENQSPEHLAMHRKLTDDFLALRVQIGEILGYSDEFADAESNEESINKIQIPLPPLLKNSSLRSTDSVMTNNVIIIDRKPFFKRLFNNRPDSIRVSEITHLEQEREEIIREFSQELHTTYITSRDRLNELRKSFSMLRTKERELLVNNAGLLHQVNNIIYTIRNTHINTKQLAAEQEIQKLSQKINNFKWMTIQALAFMFVIICLLIYYQFFTTYYERKLLDEKAYAAKLAQEKTDTLAEITHEIRTPINSLIGIVDLLQKKEVFDPQDKLLLESAYSDLRNTSKTINDILNISRIEGQSVHLTTFSIRTSVEDIIETYQNQAQLKGLTLHHEFAENLPQYIYSDEFKLRQIITNLISNAVKYSEKGTITCSIQIQKAKKLHIRITDEGVGMPKKVKDNIFKKYYTANHDDKNSSGIGLGLYITQKLVENLGGKIWYESQLGKGTTFYTEIPLPHSSNPNPNKASPSKDSSPERVSPENIHLLIVDDNQLNLLYLKQLLSNYHKVYTAKDGQEALSILQNRPVDAVITDINMPVMDGKELLKNIRKDKKLSHVKVIATSSDDERARIAAEGDKQQFDYILFKPFDQKGANKAIHTVLYGAKRGLV